MLGHELGWCTLPSMVRSEWGPENNYPDCLEWSHDSRGKLRTIARIEWWSSTAFPEILAVLLQPDVLTCFAYSFSGSSCATSPPESRLHRPGMVWWCAAFRFNDWSRIWMHLVHAWKYVKHIAKIEVPTMYEIYEFVSVASVFFTPVTNKRIQTSW